MKTKVKCKCGSKDGYHENICFFPEDKEWKDKAKEHFFEDWVEEFDKKFGNGKDYMATRLYAIFPEVKNFIRSLIVSTQRETKEEIRQIIHKKKKEVGATSFEGGYAQEVLDDILTEL